MSIKKITGFLAVVLGCVGAIGSLAVGIAVWPVGRHIADKADRITAEIEPEVRKLETRLVKYDTALKEIRVRVTDMQTVAREIVEKGYQSDAKVLAEFERLFKTVSTVTAIADRLLATIQSGTAMLQSVRKLPNLIPGFGGETDASKSEREETLKKMNRAVEQIATYVRDVRTRLDSISRKKDVGKNALYIANFAEKIEDRLTPLSDRLSLASENVTAAHSTLISIQESTDTLRTTVPFVVTLLSIWMALGQICLAVGGRRLMTRRQNDHESA